MKITVQTTIFANLHIVWTCFTEPEHIVKWNQASPDWHCPAASNQLYPGGKLCFTMAARDGSMQFDLEGTYNQIEEGTYLSYTLSDGRLVEVHFQPAEQGVHVVETFDAETENSPELQQQGWQAILDSFRHYAEEKQAAL